MRRGAEGDHDAFRVLVERWEKPVFTFLERMMGSREDAQDLGQETFLRMCREAGRYEPSGKFRIMIPAAESARYLGGDGSVSSP